MAGLEIKTTGADVPGILDRIADGLTDEMPRRVLEAAQHVTGEIRTAIFATVTSKGRKTGALARSFRETFLGHDGDTVSAASHSDLAYARIQDEGGTINPSSVSKLAVPIGKNIAIGKWPRHFGKGELVLIKSKAGNSILAKISKTGRISPQFVLVDSVTLRAKNYLAKAAVAAQPGVEEILGQGVATVVEQAAAAGEG